MSLVGSLEDLGLGDILQIVSLSRKSGVLNLAWGEIKGKIIFKDGQVVAAVSSDRTTPMSKLLADMGIVAAGDEAKVGSVVDAQSDAAAVSSALVNKLKIPADKIETAIRDRIESTVFHFFTWPEGTFSFELQEIDPEISGLKPPDHAFVLEVGLSPQFLAMEGTRLQDEYKRGRAEAPVGPSRTPSAPAKEEESGQYEEISFGETSDPTMAAPATETPPADSPAQAPEEDFGSVEEAVKYYESLQKGETPAAEPEQKHPVEVEIPIEEEQADKPEEHAWQQSAEAREEQEEKTVPGPLPDEEAAGGPEVIVVDDDTIVLESIDFHLKPRGYKVSGFTSIGAAVNKIHQSVDTGERPHTILVDVLMPNTTGSSTLGGLELLEEVRKSNPSIPVYMMSDYENELARKKSEEMGARFFFMKPKSSQLDENFDSPELINFVQVLESALNSELKTRPAPQSEKPAQPEAPETTQPREETINLGEELRREFGEEVRQPEDGQDEIQPSRGLHMLKTMISELNDPASSGQITLMILRFAAEMMNRAVIFLVAKNQIAGLGQFGISIDGIDAQKHVRQMRIPLNQPSIFREAIQKRMPLKKRLKKTKWNDYLVEHLGGDEPGEVFVAPIIAGGKIPAILYGDNVPQDGEIGDTESLEIFLAQAGLAMEKALLERRLQELGNSSGRK